MNSIRLIKANAEDASLVHRLQREAFMPLYERYRDDETSPALETVSRVAEKISDSDFFGDISWGYPCGRSKGSEF